MMDLHLKKTDHVTLLVFPTYCDILLFWYDTASLLLAFQPSHSWVSITSWSVWVVSQIRGRKWLENLRGRTPVIRAEGPRLQRSSFYSWFHAARWETSDANVAVASRLNRKFTAASVSSRCALLRADQRPSVMRWSRWPPSFPSNRPGMKLVHFHTQWHVNE